MSDYIIRATAADHHIRAFAATTKELVETARKHHETTPVVTAALGRLLTAGAMMGVRRSVIQVNAGQTKGTMVAMPASRPLSTHYFSTHLA